MGSDANEGNSAGLTGSGRVKPGSRKSHTGHYGKFFEVTVKSSVRVLAVAEYSPARILN